MRPAYELLMHSKRVPSPVSGRAGLAVTLTIDFAFRRRTVDGPVIAAWLRLLSNADELRRIDTQKLEREVHNCLADALAWRCL